MAHPAALALMLLGLVAGHASGSEEPERRLRRKSSKGSSWGSWGSWCGKPEQCSAHLSDGPADADVEIRLGGLPASTPSEAVHLKWWAPRKSPTLYDPLVSPVNCSVYSSMLFAYPKRTQADYNGGNVRVSEAGEAVIRVRAPSTYFVWRCVAIPHIHVKVCKGASGHQSSSDKIMLSGPEVWVSTKRRDSSTRVISAIPYAARDPSAAPASSAIWRPCGVITHVEHSAPGATTTLPLGTTLELLPETTSALPETTSALPETTSALPEATTTPLGTTIILPETTTALPETTSTMPPQGTTASSGIDGTTAQPAGTTTEPLDEATTTSPEATVDDTRSVQISDARDALDLDALEFSPVYFCLLEEMFFDHFSSECAQSCPANSVAAHGQCVRAETTDPQAQLQASWQLNVHCGANPCWEDNKKIASLHNARLSFAGHLDIPFQEVEISLGWSASASRRLSTTAKTAYLTVNVASDRIATAEGGALLASFPQDAAAMTTLLGLEVRSVASGGTPNQQADPSTVNQSNDPYGPAYEAVENLPDGGPPPSTSALSMLPTEAIIGIAVGVVVLASAFGALVYRRRRQRQLQARAQQVKSVDQKIAELEVESDPAPIKEKGSSQWQARTQQAKSADSKKIDDLEVEIAPVTIKGNNMSL